MNFYATILGSGAATPTIRRYCCSQVVNIEGLKLLFDCGEGTQRQVRKYRQKLQSLAHIFISHMHGDHFFGLPGLLSTMHLCGRKEPVDVFGPAGIEAATRAILSASGHNIDFEITFHELDFENGTKLLLDHKNCTVEAFKLIHSVPTYGFRVTEKPRGSKPPRSMAYCCDTLCDDSLLPYIDKVNLLIIDSTFDDDFEAAAVEKLHGTASMAARLALKADVDQLLLTHISARYHTASDLLAQARAVFENTLAAEDGLIVPIAHRGRSKK
ncbi:MAG: ribonuclease Z [Bacteroidales bacterium]|nr:ribonuclease Z [Bacteroidales bacterium]